MRDRSWMMAMLAAETRRDDALADAEPLHLLEADVHPMSYIAYLERRYAFEAPVEEAWPRFGIAPAAGLARHASQLADDIFALGGVVLAAPTVTLRDRGDALAWIYVATRARRWHGQLHRHFAHHLRETVWIGGAYLKRSGPDGARLAALGKALDAAATSGFAARRIVAAAREAYHAQNRIARAPLRHAA